MIRVHMTDDQRRELEQVSRQAVGRVALRAQMVLLTARGYRVPQIAEIHDRGQDVVRLWLHRYKEEGVRGLEDAPHPGRPRTHPLAGHSVDTQASQSPECSGHVQSCWTVGLFAAYLATRFRLVLSPSSIRRYVRALGWRWARPRLAPAHKADPEADEKEAALAAAQAAGAQGRAHLLYVDECDLHLLPVIRAMGMTGPRVRVPTPGPTRTRAFFGALDAATGAWFSGDHDRKLAVHVVAFLQQITAAYPEGPLYLALDNVTMHDAKVVRAWLAANPRVHILWLPTYAAHDAHPVERIWLPIPFPCLWLRDFNAKFMDTCLAARHDGQRCCPSHASWSGWCAVTWTKEAHARYAHMTGRSHQFSLACSTGSAGRARLSCTGTLARRARNEHVHAF